MGAHAVADERTTGADAALYAGAALTLVVGAIHLQQYLSFINEVPTINVLFLLNAAGAGAVAAALATPARTLAALGGIGLSAGALISVIIALVGTLFGYSESELRFAVVLSIVVELAAIGALGTWLAKSRARG